MRWRLLPRPRWRAVAAVVGVISVLALTLWFVGNAIVGPTADPGGRILHALRSTKQALPNDAHVLYRNDLEPKWDSCDGRSGTFGWDNVVVQIHFESGSSTDTVVHGASRAFQTLGWQQDYVNNQSTFVQLGWTRRLDNGSIAKAQLSNGVPDQSATKSRWDLFVIAPPVGPQASGC
jgi:hypothetical protein